MLVSAQMTSLERSDTLWELPKRLVLVHHNYVVWQAGSREGYLVYSATQFLAQ